MSTAVIHDERVRELVRESARWRLAGLLLRRPRAAMREQIEALSRETADESLAAAVAASADTTEGDYLALLGPGGPVSPREVSYRPIEDPGRLLAELAAYHEAFSYRAGSEDPRDHVAVAADFIGFLALKEAYAEGSGHEDQARITRESRERFVARHARRTARGMWLRLERTGVAVEFLATVLRALCEMAGADDAEDPSIEESAFLRPGLDDGLFDSGALGEESPCAGACGWPGPEAYVGETER